MRVIAGSAKGRKLEAVPGDKTKPTTDRVKESLFSILSPYLEDTTFLDAFAGTGGIGIEALSRGAKEAIFLDTQKSAIATIKENLEKCDLKDKARVRHDDAFSFLKKTPQSFDFIYLDPPNFKNLVWEALTTISGTESLLADDGMIICKMHPSEYEDFDSQTLEKTREKKYGNNLLVFYSKSPKK